MNSAPQAPNNENEQEIVKHLESVMAWDDMGDGKGPGHIYKDPSGNLDVFKPGLLSKEEIAKDPDNVLEIK